MGASQKTPYRALGISENTARNQLRVAYRARIHEHLQGKISPIDFRYICRAHETLSDHSTRELYRSHKEWIFEIPIDQYTPQQLAAEPDLIDDLKKRLKKASLIEINEQNPKSSQTTLYCAARCGNIEAVKFLTARGAEPDISQRTKSTALHVASFYGHADVVRCLLESGADYRIVNSANHTVEYEAFNDDVKKVFAELKENPYVRVAANDIDWFRTNPLTQHIDKEYFAQRQTLLHCACKKGYFDMMRWLIEEQSANVDLVDLNRNSSLHLAAYGGHRDLVDYLLNRGCDSTLKNRWRTTAEEEGSKHGRTITDLFETMRERDMFEMARKGVDWWFYYYFDVRSKDKTDSNGVSLLHYVCRYGQYSVAKWLLERGANVNIQMATKPKSTPLHDAKFYGHVLAVELLLECGADVNITDEHGATVFDQEVSDGVDKSVASKINALLLPYKRNLKTEKLLDIYIYDDNSDEQHPIAKIKVGLGATKKDLLAALANISASQYRHFSVARRALIFETEDSTIISAVCRARYVSSKFIDTPLCLMRHRILPKTENQHRTFEESDIYIRQLSHHGKVTSFPLQTPIIETKTINAGNLIFTFSESCVNEDIEFEVTTLFSSDSEIIGLVGCICLFKTDVYSDASNSKLLQLPTVSLVNEPYAHLYTLALPTSWWFTSNTRETHLPMVGGVHAFIRHVDIVPGHLTLPPDMFIAAALGQRLTTRNKPVPCTSLLLREQNTHKFPLIAYHGTNMNAIRSIILDGLVVPGTVVSSGKRIQLPIDHFARDDAYFGVSNFATAAFLSPSIHYSIDLVHAATSHHGDRQLIPVLECSVKRDSYDVYRSTIPKYTAHSDDDLKTIGWRVEDPTTIEINAVLFIAEID